MVERKVTVVLGADVAPYVSNIARADDVTIRLEGSLKSVSRTSDQVASSVSRGSDEIHRGFSRSALAASLMDGNLKQVALTAAGFFSAQFFVQGTQKIVSSIKSVITAGADWTESITKTQFAFGDASQLIIGQAEEMAHRLGVDKQVFVDNATAIGLIGKAAGLSAPAAAAMGAQFARLAVDASSFYNVPVADALTAIQSGLVGQERPLRQYGVLLDAASVSAEAVSLGLSKTGANLSQGQAVMARASLITKGFADASGDLERTQGSLANRFRAISGDIHNFEISLGDRLRPVLLAVLATMGRLGSEGLDVISAGAAALSPFLHNLVGIGRDLGTMFANTAHAAAPIAGAFAAIAGSPIVLTLNALSAVLKPIADLFAHNQIAADALAAVLLARLVPAVGGILANSTRLGAIAQPFIVLGSQAAEGIRAASGALAVFGTEEGLAVTATGALSVAFDGVAAAAAALAPVLPIVALILLEQNAAAADKRLQHMISTATQGLDLKTGPGLDQAVTNLKKLRDQAEDTAKHVSTGGKLIDNFLGGFAALGHLDPFRNVDPVTRANDALDALNSKTKEVTATQRLYGSNLDQVQHATGLTTEQVLKLAEANKVDLTSANGAAVASFIQLIFAAQSAGTAMDDAAKSRQDALTSANKVQLDSSNILSTIVTRHNELDAAQKKSAGSGETEAERQHKIAAAYLSVESAQQHVLDSRKKLDDLRNGGQEREVVQAERDVEASYAATQRAVAQLLDATRNLEDARRQAAEGRSVAEAEIAVGRAVDAQAQNVADLAKAQDKLNYAREVGIPEEIAQSEREYNELLRQQKENGFAAEDAQVALGRAQQDSLNGNRAVTTAQMDLADANRNVATSQDQQADAIRKLNELLDGGLAREMAAADLELRQAVLGVGQAEDGVAAALKKSSDAAATQAQKFDESKISLGEYMKQLEDFVNGTRAWDQNLVTLADRARHLGLSDSVVAEFRDMGVKSAPLLQQLLDSNDATFTRMSKDVDDKTKLTSDGFIGALDLMIQSGTEDVRAGGITVVDALSGSMQSQLPGLSKMAQDLGTTVVHNLVNTLGAGTPALSAVINEYQKILASGANAFIASFGGKPIALPDVTLPGLPSLGTLFPQALGGITDKPMILFGERQTGQEAFIPKLGIPRQRGLELADTAAHWHGGKVVPMATGGIASPPPLRPGAMDDIASARMHYEYDQLNDMLARKLATTAVPAGGNAPALGVVSGDIAAWFTQAVALAGKPKEWIPGLEAIAKAESGFNPTIVNPIGVPNGKYGIEHAKGVMQMLDSTFQAHAIAGHRDIFNPIDNIASSEGYIAGRYGTPFNTPLFKGGSYKGYALGGINVLDTGGYLMPGQLGLNLTPHPEKVLSPTQTMAMGAPIRPSITIHIPVTITNQGGMTVPELLDQVDRKMAVVGQRVIDTITDEMEHS